MFAKNRQKYFNVATQGSISVFFAGEAPKQSADQRYPYAVDKHYYYLSGLDRQKAILVLINGMQSRAEWLFIEGYDETKALWDGDVATKEEASSVSGVAIENIFTIDQFTQKIQSILQPGRHAIYGELTTLCLDLDRRSMDESSSIANRFANEMKDYYPFLTIQNAHLDVARLRSRKEPQEIKEIKSAIALTKRGLDVIMRQLKPGIKEFQLDAYFQFALHMNGSNQSFKTIAAAGKNATVLHYEKNNSTVESGQLVLFDLGAKVNHYCADISRTYPVDGTFTARQKAVYEVVLAANKKAIETVHPGMTFKAFNAVAKEVLIEGAKRLGLIRTDEEINKYYYHSLGHYMGLDVHDVGDYTETIEPGMVLTIEPGLYIAEEGIGIRIEDDVLITEDGCINLSADIIKEISDIEAFMIKNK